MRTLVLGGIRSGKSRWAEDAMAASAPAGEPVRYLAPGPSVSDDASWARRVATHRDRRPAHWSTVENTDLAEELRRSPAVPTLIDDLGGWLTGALDRHGAWHEDAATGGVRDTVEAALAAIDAFDATLVLVSPEVGLSVVPATAAGRLFADELGELNRRVARLCDRVVLVVAGQALSIKAPTA